MKRILLGLVLALALVFAMSSATMAAPVTAGEGGSFVVFGEYVPFMFLAPGNVFAFGAGYAISDGFVIGVEAQTIAGYFFYGGFANLSFDPLAVNAEVLLVGGDIVGRAAGLYMFDLDAFKLGVGGGVYFNPGGSTFFVEGAASIAAGESFSIYGAVDYWVEVGYTSFEAGVALGF